MLSWFFMNLAFEMNSIWIGALFFTFSFLFHLIFWRRSFLRRGLRFLFFLFLVPSLCLGIASLLFPHYFLAFLCNTVLSLNYLAIYPALQASSPSLRLLRKLFLSPVAYPPPEDTHSGQDRVQDLIEMGWISKHKTWSLSQGGKSIARFFLFFRSCLGLEEGAG